MPKFRSPAKINIFLKVLSKRPDGYHELSTLMQAIDLCDILDIHFTTGDDLLTCTDPTIPTDQHNLCNKALNLFRKKTGEDFKVHIHLNKRIPVQAGLGGGSSNAATVLWALNELSGLDVPLEDLIEWSGEIGSDITFFLSEGTAFCTGRGEKIEKIDPIMQKEPMWILKPQDGLSTPEVFRNFDIKSIAPDDSATLLTQYRKGSPVYMNDLQVAAFKALPFLQQIKNELHQSGYKNVTMTGSGSAIFCFGDTPPIIPNVKCFRTQFLNRSVDSWY